MLKNKFLNFYRKTDKRKFLFTTGTLIILFFLLLNTFYTEDERLEFRNQFSSFLYSREITSKNKNYQCDRVYWEQKITEVTAKNSQITNENDQITEKCVSDHLAKLTDNVYMTINGKPVGEPINLTSKVILGCDPHIGNFIEASYPRKSLETVPSIPSFQVEEVKEITKIFGITVQTIIKSPDTYKDKSNCEVAK